MADKLTVGSGSTSSTPVTPVAAPRGKEKVDPLAVEVERLRQRLSPSVVKRLGERFLRQRAARNLAFRDTLAAQKAIEQERSTETLTLDKSQDHQTRALQAVLAAESSQREGELSKAQLREIASNPKAGPAWPPPLAKAFSAEQKPLLFQLASLFFAPEYLEEVIDLYRPGKGGTHKIPTRPAPAATGRAFLPPNGGVVQNTGGLGEPGGLGQPAAQGRLSFKVGAGPGMMRSDTQLSSVNVSDAPGDDGLLDSSGHVNTKSSLPFKEGTFGERWNAFLYQWQCRMQKDIHQWRRLLKLLRQEEGAMSAQNKQLLMKMTEMRQSFARASGVRGFVSTMMDLPRTVLRGRVDGVTGVKKGADGRVKKQIDDFIKSIDPDEKRFGGRPYLSHAERKPPEVASDEEKQRCLSEEERQKYEDLLCSLREAGGPLSVLGLMLDSRPRWPEVDDTTDPDSPAAKTRQALVQELTDQETDLVDEVEKMVSHPTSAALLNEARRGWSDIAQGLEQQIATLPQQIEEATDIKQKFAMQEQLNIALREQPSLLRQIAFLDRAVARFEQPDGEWAAANQEAVAALDPPADQTLSPDQLAQQKREKAHMEQLLQGNDDLDFPKVTHEQLSVAHQKVSQLTQAIQAEKDDDKKKALEQERDAAQAEFDALTDQQKEMKAAVAAGDKLMDARKPFLDDLEGPRKKGLIGGGISKFEQELENSYFVAAVDNAIRGAEQAARQQRGAINGALSQAVRQAQGMLDRITQVVGMGRAR